MKLTFYFGSPNYIGDYSSEFYKANLIKTKNIEEAMALRKSDKYINISYKNSLFGIVYLEIKDRKNNLDSDPNKNIKRVNIGSLKRFLNGLQRISSLMTKEDYNKVLSILSEKVEVSERYSLHHYVEEGALLRNIDAFCLMVLYAQQYCFKAKEEHAEKLNTVIDHNERRDLRNFFADLATNEGLDIDNIKIKINNRSKMLTIKSPILMKMMIYEFARRYFRLIEGEKATAPRFQEEIDLTREQGIEMSALDGGYQKGYVLSKEEQETWEQNISFYRQEKVGRNYSVDKMNKIALLDVYMLFIENEKIFKDNTPLSYKHLLIGKLLTIAGLPSFLDKESTLSDEVSFYDDAIRKILRVSRPKKKKK